MRAAAFTLALLLGSVAHAEPAEEKPPVVLEEAGRFEMSAGFLASERSFLKTSFAFGGGSAGELGGGGLALPFQRFPFDRVLSAGPKLELRSIYGHVRMTTGFQWSYPSFGGGETTLRLPVNGVEREVVTQSIASRDLRFGLGVELPLGRVRPFVDLIGDVQWVQAALAVDGQSASYSAVNFGYSVSAGASLDLKGSFFIAAAGEVGLTGAVRWGTQLVVGGFVGL